MIDTAFATLLISELFAVDGMRIPFSNIPVQLVLSEEAADALEVDIDFDSKGNLDPKGYICLAVLNCGPHPGEEAEISTSRATAELPPSITSDTTSLAATGVYEFVRSVTKSTLEFFGYQNLDQNVAVLNRQEVSWLGVPYSMPAELLQSDALGLFPWNTGSTDWTWSNRIQGIRSVNEFGSDFDNSFKQDTIGFLGKYWNFSTKPDESDFVSLPEFGLGADFENAPMVRAKVEEFIQKSYSISEAFGSSEFVYIYETKDNRAITNVTFDSGLFSLGKSSLFREAICYENSCSFRFSIRDRFEEPVRIEGLEFGQPYGIFHEFAAPVPYTRDNIAIEGFF
ncbi:hypothetical protein [Aliiroseovarius sp. F47248L]|uniref:hypothetical protein n=1 Tax=Aliiroseovarius sp. F47248L TaxID=2926420 RepID=UPI001FF6E9F8|nr:hypothetical protein [Aliiroseovarius sp. F47248L]MCK0138936.1 hypothetical protein [Aliiroseovarius sp. F47248L]